MDEKDPFGFRPLWDALMEVYQGFAAVCDKHGLRYWLAEGNAIGALRHGDFVPWDDDVDVIMPRPDYEKFVAIADKELPSHLKYWDWRDVPDWRFTMGKVQDTRAERVLEIEKQVGHTQSNGIYIDILVIDGFPAGWLTGLIYKLKIRLIGMVCRYRRTKMSTYSRKGKLEWLLGALMSPFWTLFGGAREAMESLERVMKSVPFETAKLTWRTGASIRVTMTFPRQIWDGTIKKPFGKYEVPLPSGYDAYLRTQYGDYMQIPPEDKRKPGHTFDGHFSWWLGPVETV